MKLFIEIYVRDEPLHRWSPADFNMEMPAPMDQQFETICKDREAFACRFIEQFHLHMQPMLHCIQYYDLYLVFESKIDSIIVSPEERREFAKQINK